MLNLGFKSIGRSMKMPLARALSVLLLLIVLTGTMALAVEPEYESFDQLNGKTISMLTGAPFEKLIESKVDEVKEFTYFNSMPDMMLALKSGKTDACLMNNAIAELTVNRDEALALFPENLGESTFGIAFAKGSTEKAKWDAAYAKISEKTKNELWKKWTGADESKKKLIKQDWEGKNGTVYVACCDTLEPMSYAGEGGEIVGFDVEIVLLMAKQLDVKVNFIGSEFASVMPAVESGKALMGIGSIIVTDERKQSVDFIEYYPAAFVFIIRSKEGASAQSGILDSFKRTFITESRYKMVLSGLGITISMAAIAGVLGLLFAYFLVFIRHSDKKIFNGIISVYTAIIAGIPSVVILMVLYYVIFGSTRVPAFIVATIGFAHIYAARAYGVIWNAASSVDAGQREAALALGYTEGKAFREIILPQSRGIYEPVLQSQFIMLMKETSIAGFISVLELTKAGDLIRSRTMEAFFPLIAIALIYFVLTWLTARAFAFVQSVRLKKRNQRVIKGVD